MQNTLCERIKKLRDSFSYIEFGKKLNLSAASIERWEKGRNDIKSDAIIQICQICGVSADWLLGLSDRMKPLSLVHPAERAGKERELYGNDCPECVKKDAVIAEMRATIVEAMKTSEPNNTPTPPKTRNGQHRKM